MKITRIETGVLAANCWILQNSKNEAVIIDPGDDAEEILKVIGSAKVLWILLTHSHFDHLGALNEVAVKTGGKIVIHAAEAETVENGEPNPPNHGEQISPTSVARKLENSDVIEFGKKSIEVIHTPGHTPGSCCFLIEEELFAGDTLFHKSCGRVDLPGGDIEAMRASLQKLMKLPENTIIHSGHGENWNIREARKFDFDSLL